MNLPKQSRPVMRDVSQAPLKAQVEGSQSNLCIFCRTKCDELPGVLRVLCYEMCNQTLCSHG
jgi:hypothetical protein